MLDALQKTTLASMRTQIRLQNCFSVLQVKLDIYQQQLNERILCKNEPLFHLTNALIVLPLELVGIKLSFNGYQRCLPESETSVTIP